MNHPDLGTGFNAPLTGKSPQPGQCHDRDQWQHAGPSEVLLIAPGQAAWPNPSAAGFSPRSWVKSASSFESYASGVMPSSWVEYSPNRLMCAVRYGVIWARSSGSISQLS